VGRARKVRVQAEAKRLLEAGVAGQVFPGGAACISFREGDVVEHVVAAAGRLASTGGPRVDEATPYDLASLTKPVVATAALRLEAQGKLDLGTRADALLTDVRGGPGGVATIEQLLAHRSGLAAWGGLYLDVPHEAGSMAARRWILSEAARRSEREPGLVTEYSDLGYIIAGEAVARAAGASLDEVVEAQVTGPLGISAEVFYAGALPAEKRAELMRKVAPTERCEWRGRIVRGEVHDENCAALGGVAGHAGLFGTAHGVSVFGRAILDCVTGKSDFLDAKVMERALADRGGRYRFGWDIKSGNPSAAGRHLGPRTFGHLGFTGTSLWCDPDRDLVVVLLTNRVHPSRANEKIKGFRPAFHDGVVAAVLAS
jgi:CubicO group peptidase (beta-lactamase class C family)